MATSMPLPIPPRTPTPDPDEPSSPQIFASADPEMPFDNNSLSPLHAERENMSSLGGTLSSPVSPLKQNANGGGPFNFQPATMAKSPVIKSNIGQRRGHKYKHSSVSHQIFLEPPPRAPLALPNSLPIPTFAECRASMTNDQKVRFYWSICHMAVAGYTAWNAHGSAAMEALSHLIFYDSLGALLCVLVEIFSNFEVWGRSSVRHPFGLQRMEVIAGFALSVLLIFFGFDLISHNAKHALEGIGHEPHHPHAHHRVTTGTIDLTALIALAATLVSAVGLQNHARIGKAMRFAAMESLPSLLSNPSHFLTLSCSATMLMLPLLSLHTYEWVDKILSLSIALSMLFLGVHLGRNVGAMLLMSLPSRSADVAEVVKAIEAQPLVRSVEHAKFWQAHYGMGMANLRLRVIGTEENLLKLRETISSIIRNRLSGGYGSGSSGQKWEVSVQFKVDTDSAISQSHAHFSPVPRWTPT
ncbi:cation diffusion zinc membrane transporter Zrg17 [Rhinocladiella similis]